MSGAEHVLNWLQAWYADQCNEDWEHEWGVKIETLDNPGWSVSIDLEETDLEDCEYPDTTSTVARTTGYGRGPPTRSLTPGAALPISPKPSRCSAPGRPRTLPEHLR